MHTYLHATPLSLYVCVCVLCEYAYISNLEGKFVGQALSNLGFVYLFLIFLKIYLLVLFFFFMCGVKKWHLCKWPQRSEEDIGCSELGL